MMEYQGRYPIFDPSRMKTYPVRTRQNKVTLDDIVLPEQVDAAQIELDTETRDLVHIVADQIVAARRTGHPVIWFTGAHLIKNGLGRLLADLVERGIVTLVAGQMATAIHDFELALVGETSEDVPQALEQGRFGMAYEFAYQNTAMQLGDRYRLGLGESLGRMMVDEAFRTEVLELVGRPDAPSEFHYPEVSVIHACYQAQIPLTIHAGIGTDVLDQHPSFDGRAKGGCSGRDFLIYTREVTQLTGGGVILNVGSAVTGPEVLLKAVSMAANTGAVPHGIVTADFDLRDYAPEKMTDEADTHYYFRDQKSVVTRIPDAFEGIGYYVQGNQVQTIPLLYALILDQWDNGESDG